MACADYSGSTDGGSVLFRTARVSHVAYRRVYPESFRLVVALTRLETLARTATAAAVRLDTDEAPQREIDRQKRAAADAAAAQEKAKAENKAQFRP